MQVIPKMNSHLLVRLDSPFEIFAYEQDDIFVDLVRLHLGIQEATFEKHIPCDDGTLLLDFCLGYDYIEDIADIKKNLTISNYSKKVLVG